MAAMGTTFVQHELCLDDRLLLKRLAESIESLIARLEKVYVAPAVQTIPAPWATTTTVQPVKFTVTKSCVGGNAVDAECKPSV